MWKWINFGAGKIQFPWIFSYLMSSISEGDFTLMMGINVSIIHWFAQSHFQLLKRKSISPTSSQRPSKSCESVVKLLLYRMSCAERKSKNGYTFSCVSLFAEKWESKCAYRGDWRPFFMIWIFTAWSTECLLVYAHQFRITLGVQTL